MGIIIQLLRFFFFKITAEAPVSFSFFHFLSLSLTSQTPSKDNFSKDEWLNLLPP